MYNSTILKTFSIYRIFSIFRFLSRFSKTRQLVRNTAVLRTHLGTQPTVFLRAISASRSRAAVHQQQLGRQRQQQRALRLSF